MKRGGGGGGGGCNGGIGGSTRERRREREVCNGRATMRCDRAAMSCGRPRWSRSDPCTPRVQPRPRMDPVTGQSSSPPPFFPASNLHFQVGDFFHRGKVGRNCHFEASTNVLFNHLPLDWFAFFSFQGAACMFHSLFYFLE